MSSREKCETWHFSRLRLQTTSEKCFKKRTLKKLTAFSGLETWPKQPDVLKSHQEKDAPQRKETICGNSVFVTSCLGWSKVVGDQGDLQKNTRLASKTPNGFGGIPQKHTHGPSSRLGRLSLPVTNRPSPEK